MGVKKLTQLLRDQCPNLFKSLPYRYADLTGKRIVIDGNLYLMKFHYRRKGDAFRHIIGWYTMAKELSRHGVSAICVFDGKDRDPSKAKKLELKRKARLVSDVRLKFEDSRQIRLKEFRMALRLCATLSLDDQWQILKALSSNPLCAQRFPFIASQLETSISANYVSDIPTVPRPTSFELIRNKVLSLNAEFLTATLSSTSGTDGLLTQDQTTPVERPVDALNNEEESLWRNFIESLGKSPETLITETLLDPLLAHSNKESEKLSKRVNQPTNKTYAECIALLRTMGIPCIVATGTTEAEALASSLVLNGHADYVVSDDNDVLVHGAPLIMDLEGGQQPIITIARPGQHVHSALGLSKDSFIDLAILLGCDFVRGSNLKPDVAYRLIKKHGTIENVMMALKNCVDADEHHEFFGSRDGYVEGVTQARMMFRDLPPLPPPSTFKAIQPLPLLTAEIMNENFEKRRQARKELRSSQHSAHRPIAIKLAPTHCMKVDILHQPSRCAEPKEQIADIK